jgi:hypothetical protein
MTRK